MDPSITHCIIYASNTKGDNSAMHHHLDGTNYPRNLVKNLSINIFKKKLKIFLIAQH